MSSLSACGWAMCVACDWMEVCMGAGGSVCCCCCCFWRLLSLGAYDVRILCQAMDTGNVENVLTIFEVLEGDATRNQGTLPFPSTSA